MTAASPILERRSPVVGSRRGYAVVLLIVVAFIVYGSLFPFVYRRVFFPGGPAGYLLSTWQDWDKRGDLLSNILLYIPLGFFATLSLPPRIPSALRALLATIAGTALSCCIEMTQFYDLGRVTSMGDVYANAIGAGLGATMAVMIGPSLRWPLMAELAANPDAAIVLLMFFAYRLYPYVPMIDMHKYWHALWPIIRTPSLPWDQFANSTITWLSAAVLVDSLYGTGRLRFLYALLCGIEFVGKIFIVDNVLTLPDVLGALVAYALWAGLLRRLPGRFLIVTLLFAGMIVVERLQPWHFVLFPRSFGWIPFTSLMRSETSIAMLAFCWKFYAYGALIWLLGRCGIGLITGTLVTVVLLFATSYAERWLPGRSAEITDTTMALMIGGAFVMLRCARRTRTIAVPSQTAAAREHARLATAILAQHGAWRSSPRPGRRNDEPSVPRRPRG